MNLAYRARAISRPPGPAGSMKSSMTAFACLRAGMAQACDCSRAGAWIGRGVIPRSRLPWARSKIEAVLFAFDLLELGGKDLRRSPLEERKRELAKLLRKEAWALQLNEHIAEPGDVVFRHACKLGFVGGTTGSAGVLD